jgi:lipoprotein-releasing system permease protein
MVHIATAAVAVSLAVVLVSLSIIFGFKEEISRLVSGTVSDVTVSAQFFSNVSSQEPISDSEALHKLISSTENVAHIERYASLGCVIRGESGATGIALKGIGSEASTSVIAERLESGSMPRIEEARRKEILLSRTIASTIGVETNDRVELLILGEENETPRREVFKVCGIYRSALGEMGAELALTDIRNVQKLNGWDYSQISGYACRLKDSDLADQTASAINQRLVDFDSEDTLLAISSHERYQDIFAWLETHDINAMIIAIIMLVVAIFNVVTALLILVLEQTRMVGILKSLGMQNGTIRKIFTYRTARIIGIGITIGNILAIGILLAQRYLHIVKLEENGYFLSEVPVSFGAGWIVATNVAFVVIILVATHLATSIVGRIKVADAIKYN